MKSLKSLLFIMLTSIGVSSQAALAEDLVESHDGNWITLSGTVVEAEPDLFRMDYGKGIVTVEMDDWNWYDQEGRAILSGDDVIVQGRVDNSLYERKSIEASSVYVKSLNTYFYASSADEEGDVDIVTRTNYAPFMGTGWLSFSGIVSDVEGREIILNTAIGEVHVDTSTMDYNPVDNIGFQQIEEGDKIVVNGRLDTGFYENKEVLADSLITIHGDA
ncbi:MAG: hypothetical protein HUJ29_12815 [Gammaproteobacteria bacterium]|nr:hypothetical protein [Gammaproteobacteria bacterium]